jgi:hypothetical protein
MMTIGRSRPAQAKEGQGSDVDQRMVNSVLVGQGHWADGGASLATPIPWFLLPDVVDVVLSRLTDGKHLAKSAGVNRLWNKEASSEKVWAVY